MLSYHNDPTIKQKILAQLQAHFDADEIIKGIYWENGKGCAVGCAIHSGSHIQYEIRFGIPQVLAKLEDGLFEKLPNEIAKQWPIRFMSAIPVGIDLSHVFSKWVIWLLIDPIYGVIRFVKKDSAQEIAILRVADIYQKKISAASEAASYAAAADAAAADADAAAADAAAAASYAAADAAAEAAASYAAEAAASAADAAAADASYAAADAASYASYAAADAASYASYASYAADAAADAAAADAASYAAADAAASAYAAARTKHYLIMADKLIEIIEST